MLKYRYHRNEGYLLCQVYDEVLLDDVFEYLECVIADQTIDRQYFEIVDFSKADGFDFGYYRSGRLMDKLKQLQQRKQCLGSCLIVSNKLILEMVNMFGAVGRSRGLNIFVFETIDEAFKHIDDYFAR